MNLKPLFDRVIAKPILNKKVTSSGITLTESDEGEVKKAIVVATGRGSFEGGIFNEMQLEVDDVIYYEEHTCAKLFFEGKDYILISQLDVLAYERK